MYKLSLQKVCRRSSHHLWYLLRRPPQICAQPVLVRPLWMSFQIAPSSVTIWGDFSVPVTPSCEPQLPSLKSPDLLSLYHYSNKCPSHTLKLINTQNCSTPEIYDWSCPISGHIIPCFLFFRYFSPTLPVLQLHQVMQFFHLSIASQLISCLFPLTKPHDLPRQLCLGHWATLVPSLGVYGHHHDTTGSQTC